MTSVNRDFLFKVADYMLPRPSRKGFLKDSLADVDGEWLPVYSVNCEGLE